MSRIITVNGKLLNINEFSPPYTDLDKFNLLMTRGIIDHAKTGRSMMISCYTSCDLQDRLNFEHEIRVGFLRINMLSYSYLD